MNRQYEAKTMDHCLMSAICTILYHDGLDVPDTDIFSLYNGIGLEYRNLYEGFIMPRILKGMICDGAEITPLNVHANIQWLNDTNVLLQNGNILIQAYTMELSYNSFYKKKENRGRSHYIILERFTDENQKVQILDPHFTNNYSRAVLSLHSEIDITSFQKSVIEAYSVKTMLLKQHNEDVCKDRLLNSIQDFLTIEEKSGYYYGLHSLYHFINDWILLKHIGEQDAVALTIKINYNIKACSIVYILKYISKCLQQYLELEKKIIIEKINLLIQKWSDLAFYILLCGMKKDFSNIQETVDSAYLMLSDLKDTFTDVINVLNKRGSKNDSF